MSIDSDVVSDDSVVSAGVGEGLAGVCCEVAVVSSGWVMVLE